jgi:ribonuclease III
MSVIAKIKKQIKNNNVFITAFTHTSYAHENKLPYSYERLEFLGDAILNYLVSTYIYFYSPYMSEGEMTNLRSKAVRQETLSSLSLELNLNKYLLLGNGEENSQGREKISILSDIFESFVAAIYISFGREMTWNFLEETLFLKIKKNKLDGIIDYKSLFQEHVQGLHLNKKIEYKVVKQIKINNKNSFFVNLLLDNQIYGQGESETKKLAEQKAAKEALEKLNSNTKTIEKN